MLAVVYFIFKIAFKAIKRVDIEAKVEAREDKKNMFAKHAKKVSDEANKKAKSIKKKLDNFINSDF